MTVRNAESVGTKQKQFFAKYIKGGATMETERTCYCRKCIDYFKTQGYKIWVGGLAYDAEEAEEENIVCDWCEEVDDLYEVAF